MDASTSLSLLPKLLLSLSLPSSLALLYLASPTTAALSTLVLIPPAAFFWLCSQSATPGLLDTLTWTFFGTGTIGVMAVTAIQAGLSYAYAYILFGDQASDYSTEFQRANEDEITPELRAKRLRMAHNWRYILFLVLFTLTAAGFLEETMKYLAVHFGTRTSGGAGGYMYLQCAIASTLGFSVVENIGYIYAARHGSTSTLALTVIERIILGMPAHALSGCLIATGLIRRDISGQSLSFGNIIAAPTFYHSLFDFSLFSLCAANGHIGWIHPKDFRSLAVMLISISIVLSAAFVHLRINMQALGLW